jgi:hypothetical protein
MESQRFLRRAAAAEYLSQKYGFCSGHTLGKLATVGGGPPFRKVGVRIVIYEQSELDSWARSKISEVLNSTSGELRGRGGRPRKYPVAPANAAEAAE